MNTTLVNYKDIVVGKRFRKDYKDLETLAESIRDNGFIHPPCVNQETMELIAGGRRHRAWALLLSGEVETTGEAGFVDYSQIPVYKRSVNSDAEMLLLELEENLRRESMTWQENAVGIYEYNRAAKGLAYANGDRWSQRQTAQLLNVSQGRVATVLNVVKEMKKEPEDGELSKCETMMDAIKVLLSRKLDNVNKVRLKRTHDAQAAAIPSDMPELDLSDITANLSKGLEFDKIDNSLPSVSTVEPVKEIISYADISKFYRHGNSLELLTKLNKIDHIVCDPPYGIDMKNLDTDASIERVAETHEVGDNLQLLPEFIQTAYNVLTDHGFLVMWYDLDHHEKIKIWGESAGFKVCRWPLTWCKTSPCRNSAAQYNITKSTEVCYFMRKSEQALLQTKQSNNFILEPAVSSPTHPFIKPFNVWKYLIEAVSMEGQTIVDPFAGEGSSLEAIYKLDRTPIGLEIDEAHIANGVARLHKSLNVQTITASPFEL